MSFKKVVEILICILIAVHILVICLIPFPQTIFYNSLPKVLIKYANQIGIHNSWNMFAPDPSPEQKLELRYFADKEALVPEIAISEPQGKLYGLTPIRKFYQYNYFMASDERIFKEMEPVLCKNREKGYWVLKTWGKFDRKEFALTRDMVMDCADREGAQ